MFGAAIDGGHTESIINGVAVYGTALGLERRGITLPRV